MKIDKTSSTGWLGIIVYKVTRDNYELVSNDVYQLTDYTITKPSNERSELLYLNARGVSKTTIFHPKHVMFVVITNEGLLLSTKGMLLDIIKAAKRDRSDVTCCNFNPQEELAVVKMGNRNQKSPGRRHKVMAIFGDISRYNLPFTLTLVFTIVVILAALKFYV